MVPCFKTHNVNVLLVRSLLIEVGGVTEFHTPFQNRMPLRVLVVNLHFVQEG